MSYIWNKKKNYFLLYIFKDFSESIMILSSIKVGQPDVVGLHCRPQETDRTIYEILLPEKDEPESHQPLESSLPFIETSSMIKQGS